MKYLDNSFFQYWQKLDSKAISLAMNAVTPENVASTLQKQKLDLDDMLALLSPAAQQYLETLAQRSQKLTRQRFGNTLGFFVPLYLSSLCANDCSYCGFAMSNKIKRSRLTPEQVEAECIAIKALGFDTILLVTGEHENKVGVEYFRQVLPIITRYFSYIMLEVQPLSSEQYKVLQSYGVDAVSVYQETYNDDVYAQHHLKGNKTDFRWRLETADRLGLAGMDKVGLGCLLGLDNWRVDCFKLAAHLDYLQRTHWKTRYCVAFPRLRPCAGGLALEPQNLPSDADLVQLITAFRLFSSQVDIVVSTRESAALRDNILRLGVTQISAGSKTQPGGYASSSDGMAQFEISDARSPKTMANIVEKSGLEVVWKDWHRVYSKT